MASALRLGARGQQRGRRMVNADERQHQPWCVGCRKFLIQHDLFGHRQAAAPFARPVRHREPRGVQLGEPRLLET